MKITTLHNQNSKAYYQFIQSIDNDFFPKLSKRAGGIKGFIDKVYDEGGEIHIAKKDRIIVGSLSYWITEANDVYVWLIVTASELRGTHEGKKLVFNLVQSGVTDLLQKKGNLLRYVEFTTWENNYPARKLYEILACRHYKTIANHMMEGRNTYCYRTHFKDFCKNFEQIKTLFSYGDTP